MQRMSGDLKGSKSIRVSEAVFDLLHCRPRLASEIGTSFWPLRHGFRETSSSLSILEKRHDVLYIIL